MVVVAVVEVEVMVVEVMEVEVMVVVELIVKVVVMEVKVMEAEVVVEVQVIVVATPTCDVRRRRFSKRLVAAAPTHTWWCDMSPLKKFEIKTKEYLLLIVRFWRR